ncbi:MAG: hypothetical protein U5K28_10270 [Halobacteriales archaeon]|nr:hypothetical protein [Halobacteriales archaeon]
MTGYTGIQNHLKQELHGAVRLRRPPGEDVAACPGTDPDNECVEEIYDLIDSRFERAGGRHSAGSEYELIRVTNAFDLNVAQRSTGIWRWSTGVRADRRPRRTSYWSHEESGQLLRDVRPPAPTGDSERRSGINTWLEQHGYRR